MTPPPPRSTLFPYTTLFRSVRGHRPRILAPYVAATGAGRPSVVGMDRSRGRLRPGKPDALIQWQGPSPREGTALLGSRGGRDRKSTRLNSSHSQISYAVFCLNDTSPTALYTLSLHDALPICKRASSADPSALRGRDGGWSTVGRRHGPVAGSTPPRQT